jgi:predicted amidohydrolase YtcJ
VSSNQSKENVLDRTTALNLFTTEVILSSKKIIQKGFYSDIVILDKDYFFIADDEMPALNAVLTIVDGKVVYVAEEYKSVARLKLSVIPE